MKISDKAFQFWCSWLLIVVIGVICFGLILVILPELSMQGFSGLIYGSFNRISHFTPEAFHYITLAHAVFGSVLIGWGITLFYLIQHFFRKGIKISWSIISLSFLGWFVPDTIFSLTSGYSANALLNMVFLFLFAVPLVTTYGYFRK